MATEETGVNLSEDVNAEVQEASEAPAPEETLTVRIPKGLDVVVHKTGESSGLDEEGVVTLPIGEAIELMRMGARPA